jgi:hypothetical protein
LIEPNGYSTVTPQVEDVGLGSKPFGHAIEHRFAFPSFNAPHAAFGALGL